MLRALALQRSAAQSLALRAAEHAGFGAGIDCIRSALLADQPPAWRALGQPATRRLEGLVSLCVTAQLDAEPRHPEVLRRDAERD